MSSSGKAAVTGVGLISPLGKGVAENFKGVIEGRSGISLHDERSEVPECLKYFGRVEGLDKLEGVPAKVAGQTRFLNRGSMLGFEAAREAIDNSGLELSCVPRERRSLFIASGDFTNLGYEFIHPALREVTRHSTENIDLCALNKATLDRVNPFFLLESINNNLFSFLSASFEFMGPNTSLASLSPLGGNALELACGRILCGEADVALAVGCGSWVNEVPMYELEGLGILSKCKRGGRSFRPLDRSRDGFIPGEGGAAILVENAESAKKRGAPILAMINGFGNCIELPHGKGLSVPELISKRCIESALEQGSFEPGDLAFICPHGSGTRKGDRSELQSIAEVLGKSSESVRVCALKPYTGHMGAASDLAEVIIGIKALMEGVVPGTLNFCRAESGFEDLGISSSNQQATGKSFISVSYGIFGQSSSVLVETL